MTSSPSLPPFDDVFVIVLTSTPSCDDDEDNDVVVMRFLGHCWLQVSLV